MNPGIPRPRNDITPSIPTPAEPCCLPGAKPIVAGSLPVPLPRITGSDQHEHPELISIPGGFVVIGSDAADALAADGEGPARRVLVRPFCISPIAVTNAAFAAFVRSTGYRTDAERYGWSFVFFPFLEPAVQRQSLPGPPETPWWRAVPGACWHAPEGSGSSVAGRGDHPVVHISWNDAQSYCDWGGMRLPTEAEWEVAARGGLDQARYPWGDDFTPEGQHHCNIWQGRFPDVNTQADSFAGTANVTTYPPNAFGLYNVVGNVWEWCQG